MSHTQAYPRQLYGIENEWDICQVRRRSTRRPCSPRSFTCLVCEPVVVVRPGWNARKSHSDLPWISETHSNTHQGFTTYAIHDHHTFVCRLQTHQQVSFLVSFFLVEASSQNSSALGFAVLEIPDDVRLSDGGAELSADVTSPQGQILEDVVCVVDIKASGPPPRERDASYVEDDVSWDTVSGWPHAPPLCRAHNGHKYELAVRQRLFLQMTNP